MPMPMPKTRVLVGLLLCLLLPLQSFAVPAWQGDDCPMEAMGGEHDAPRHCCGDGGLVPPAPLCQACAACAVGAPMLTAAIAVVPPDLKSASTAPASDGPVTPLRRSAVWRPPT